MKLRFNAFQEGAPFYGVPLFVAVLLAVIPWPSAWALLSLPFFLFGGFALFFFRDPPRASSAERGEAVSPADGTVVAIEDLDDTPFYDGPCRRVSVFLSVFNVHVNRAPLPGTVRRIQYEPGQFMNAMKPETSERNEANAVWLDTDYGPITVRQIAGAVARRIVCVVEEGENLKLGEKFGMIRFGSRTELYLPPKTEVCVTLKEKVFAGRTIMARFR